MFNVTANARRFRKTAGFGLLSTMIMAATMPALAQEERVQDYTLPSMPLAQALQKIAAMSGKAIRYDPDAVENVAARPVEHAATPLQAIETAIGRAILIVDEQKDGSFDIYGTITVTARRDEAEINALVRQASTSDRSGLSLREQPRNTQVISAKTIGDQQALSITDVLRNAGSVSAQLNNPNAGVSYTVRGFNSGGLINGLSGSSTYGVTAGASQPVASIERVEILKGPDALLVGFDNLGGNVNVVTKKPSANTRVDMSVDTGSYGLLRGVIDANGALTEDDKFTARAIASAQRADRNYGGYTGNKEYLFAPSLRFKDAKSDIILGATLTEATTGIVPFTLFDPNTKKIIERSLSTPIFSGDQSVHIETKRVYLDATHEFTPNIAFVARGLHDDNKLGLDVYPLGRNRQGQLVAAVRGSGQQGKSNAADAFFRFNTAIGSLVKARLNVGYNYSSGYFEPLSSSAYTVIPNIPLGANNSIPVPPRPEATNKSFRLKSQQQGIYGQMLVEIGKLKLLGGVRRNWYETNFEMFGFSKPPPTKNSADVPNFGIIYDATDNFSIFANYVKGNSPVTSTDVTGNPLPNITSTNKEAGVKLDLFNERATINASYFDIQQDNTLVPDTQHPGFSLPAPGQRGRGIDLNIVGQIMSGWTVQASLTRTNYVQLTPTAFRKVVFRQPRVTYSLYSNYRTEITDELTGGFGVGLFGRTHSYADNLGAYVVPGARQVDVNGFLSFDGFDVNLGIRNLFDRRNYNVTTVPDFVPVDEPRNVRLSISKRLF
ncbi:TonB-dependent receptor [Niveispirillum sp. SYP-B3756]|uniref:TonB-dependent siderophore receptor n=1 Tax=Niveispirillum sp. SYP-B3756 TaxID=2662178 RepID=UPI001291EBA0|nr:TonB-dependent receptor [Niveispirillum sp. SYP-B3756]MQP65084.1 TonB-dependent receptor [Niveispirillum sp. SYP-B3756]